LVDYAGQIFGASSAAAAEFDREWRLLSSGKATARRRSSSVIASRG